jgi:ABC-type antimicrobial peptide transport system permease subunit
MLLLAQNFLSVSPKYLFCILPLIISVSLVFAGTRHENLSLVFKHALGTARWIGTLLLIIVVAFFVLNYFQ